MSWHLPAGTAAAGPYAVDVRPGRNGWSFTSVRVLELGAGEEHRLETGEDELLVLPMSGSCSVTCDDTAIRLTGRPDPFAGLTDFVYLPRDAGATIRSERGGRFALPGARCRNRLEVRYGSAVDVPVELRGRGTCSRQVHGYCMPETFAADQLLVCEVLTPAGNWSSYPPHKHDEDRHDRSGRRESILEEIYLFQIASGPAGPGMAYHRVYGPGIDVLAEVRDGDVVLVPHGWHGPSMAVPGYDLYYLNVMAGPGDERAWLITDDPDHEWVRDTWERLPVDPRLPMGAPPAKGEPQ